MEYNEYLFTLLAQRMLKDYLNEHHYEYDSRFPIIQKLYDYFKLTDDGDGDLYTKIEDFLFERKAEIEKYGTVKLNKIKKETFLNWIFDDYSDSKGWFIDYAFEKLYTKGELCINLNDIIEMIEYIPGHLCEFQLDEMEYYANEVIIY